MYLLTSRALFKLGAWALLCCKLGLFQAWAGESIHFSSEERDVILTLSPLGPPPPDPTNRYEQLPEAIELGKQLFFSRKLSKNGELSCATCHDPNKGWSDGRQLAKGLLPGLRRAPSIANVAHHRWFFWDGRAVTLWQQALQPLSSSSELGMSPSDIAAAIRNDPELTRQYITVFGINRASAKTAGESSANISDAEWVFVNVGKALAAFVRTLQFDCSPFDEFVEGLRRGNLTRQQKISEEAMKGVKLFIGKSHCIFCHHGPLLSDKEFHNIFLPPPVGNRSVDMGRFGGVRRLFDDPYGPRSEFSDSVGSDRAKLLSFLQPRSEMVGAFKTPSLRNVAVSPPYMHAGQYSSLRAVLDHYSEMADAMGMDHYDGGILVPTNLSEHEKQSLVEFLKSLTDYRLQTRSIPSGACTSTN